MISRINVFMESTEWDIETGLCGCCQDRQYGNSEQRRKKCFSCLQVRSSFTRRHVAWRAQSGQFYSPTYPPLPSTTLCSSPAAANKSCRHLYIHSPGCAPSHSKSHPPPGTYCLYAVPIWMRLTLQQCSQVSLLAVDEMHMSLPKMKKDIYWDDSAARPPYTLAAADYCIPSFLGSTVQMA